MNPQLPETKESLERNNAYWTAKEIYQQGECWQKTETLIEKQRESIDHFIQSFLALPEGRVILTGAGTSAFAGKVLAPYLTRQLNRVVEAISTTDIVSSPGLYLLSNKPTLLISFARSGNSPESIAAFNLANQLVNNCFHIVVTCSETGQLFTQSKNKENALALLMPKESNDQSFAMTSSFTCMMLAIWLSFAFKSEKSKETERLSTFFVNCVAEVNEKTTIISKENFNRVIYLGSGGFQGLAQEAALKLLELGAGKVITTYDSPLGFRHGPKSIIDDSSLVWIFISNDEYTRRYDLDLLKELRRDKRAKKVIAITAKQDNLTLDENTLLLSGMENATDMELMFTYIVIAQLYAFHRSLALGNSPDNPCPTGEVNRVVQGVTLYSYK